MKHINLMVQALMKRDYDYNEKQENYIINNYKEAMPKTKMAIDNIFIALCGYSLKSILVELNLKNIEAGKVG